MKNILIKIMMVLVCLTISLTIYAYDFEVDGIYYNIISATDLTVAVAPKNGTDQIGLDGQVIAKGSYNVDAYVGIVRIPENVTYNNTTYKVIEIDESAFIQCMNLVDVIIPSSVENIAPYAFWNCKKLEKLHIPKSVRGIAFNTTGYGSYENYFYGCDSLEKISVEDGNARFSSMDNCNAIVFYRTIISHNVTDTVLIFAPATTMTIPNSVDYISGAFMNSKIKELDIPASVKVIEEYSFCESKDLKKIRFLDGKEDLVLQPVHTLKYNAFGTFKDCPLESVYIGRPIKYDTHVGGTSPFDGCTQLKYVEYGDYIDNISYNMILFEECKNIETIVLGKNITNISSAFGKCEKIKSISVKNITPPQVGMDFSETVYTTSILKIPKGTLNAYTSHPIWGRFKNIVETFDFSRIDNVVSKKQLVVDVYNLQGVRVRNGVQKGEATQDLPQGIYIINGEKVLVK